MKLEVYSIEKTLFDGEVKSITLATTGGEITVLDNHLPLITIVKPGEIYYTDQQNKEDRLSLAGGILEVRPDSEAIILANTS